MMHRALTDQQRRGAFAVVAVLLLVVVAVMSALDGGRHGHGDSRNAASATTRSPASAAPRIVDASASTTSATAFTSTTSATTSTATRRTRSAAARRLILADARRFLSAYLVYEVRPLDARGRATLRASTIPGFARHLLRVRVKLPARNRPVVGRVRTLRVQDRPGRTNATVGATVQNGAWVSGLMLRLRSRGGRWLVAGLK